MNILIPMAGAGSRFKNAGYDLPKPLIDIRGKPMIQHVVENLNVEGQYIFIVQKEHRQLYDLDNILKKISKNCKIIETDRLTEGAACTTLLAKEYINTNDPLFISNSDHFFEWNAKNFFNECLHNEIDGNITVFNNTDPKWSFVKLNENGHVIEVAEKKVISDIATAGIYFWKKGSQYVKYSEQMINKNIRVNNEFYVCPVFNEAIQDGKKIKTYNIEKMWGLGTPEDLQYFLKNYEVDSTSR